MAPLRSRADFLDPQEMQVNFSKSAEICKTPPQLAQGKGRAAAFSSSDGEGIIPGSSARLGATTLSGLSLVGNGLSGIIKGGLDVLRIGDHSHTLVLNSRIFHRNSN